MVYYPIEDLLKNVHSIYKLVNLAAKRSHQLKAKAVHAGVNPGKKETTLALEEIAQGKVVLKVKSNKK